MLNVEFKIIHQIVCAFLDTLAIQLECVHRSRRQNHRNVTNNRAILRHVDHIVNVEKLMAIQFAHAYKDSLEHRHNVDQNVQRAVNVLPIRRVLIRNALILVKARAD